MTNLRYAVFWICFGFGLTVALFNVAEARPVFPGAKGFGTDTRAAYGAANNPVICIVTDLTHGNGTLGNSTRNGVSVKTGSFRECVNYAPPANTGVVIIFEVSGYITATGGGYYYDVNEPYTTIAFQTAPSPGVTLRNIHLYVRDHDILVTHPRIRAGDLAAGDDPGSRRNLTIQANTTNVYNVVIDHGSFSWGADSTASFSSEYGYNVYDVTWSYCIFAENLFDSIDPEGEHSMGPAYGPNSANISVHNSLISNTDWRNPYVREGSNQVFANNIIYNVRSVNMYAESYTTAVQISAENNWIEGGPLSSSTAKNYFPRIVTVPSSSQIYLSGNRTDLGTQSSSSDWSYVSNGSGHSDATLRETSRISWPADLTSIAASGLKSYLLPIVGSRPVDRDTVDTRYIYEVTNDDGPSILYDCVVNCGGGDDQVPEGGYPALATNTRNVETISFPSDPHGDDDTDGYTNLEEWLHELAAQVEGKSGTGSDQDLSSPTGLRIVSN